MKKYLLGFGIIFILMVICIQDSRVSIYDGPRNWQVIAGYGNRREAAQLLGKVNHNLIEFMRVLKIKYHIDETDDVINGEGHVHARVLADISDTHNIVSNILDNYNPDMIYENDARGDGKETSYTVNKGAAMYVCLRNKLNPNALVDYDTLLFVMLHEISHIGNYRGWGHGDDFWQIFQFILREAYLAGIYTPIDYSKSPRNYCGLKIEYNPLFDPKIVPLQGPPGASS